jgi:hypothetical protein
MKKLLVLAITLLALSYGGCWVYNNYHDVVNPGYHSKIYTPEKYIKLKDSLRMEREAIAAAFLSSPDKRSVIDRARKTFTTSVTDKLFPFWYGTDWAFHGTSQVPGEGSIACGYFVTTVLRDAGVKIDRVKLAQCASEEMIKSLVPAKSIKRFSNISIDEFEKAVKKWGDGVYVVGLDNHTGFIICSRQKVTFVHSGGGVPLRVIAQAPADAKLLADSKYRVLARLSESETFLEKWAKGEKF